MTPFPDTAKAGDDPGLNLEKSDEYDHKKIMMVVIAFDTLATKADLETLELRLESKMVDHKADLIKWIIGLLFAQTALLAGLKLLGH